MTETDRRRFLAALAAFGLAGAARPLGAAPAARRYAAARFDRGDAASLAIFDDTGAELAAAPLPARAHDTAVSPDGRLLVVSGRRPGRQAWVFDARDLRPLGRIEPPPGLHFNGHGRFSADGRLFYTAESDAAAGSGVIGIHDVGRDFARIGAFASDGVGPHDLALTPDGRHLVVANGGIATDPATGRDVVVAESMRPDLTVLSLADGRVVAKADLGADLRLSSIRHLAVAADGEVVFGCQFEGEAEAAPLLVGGWRPGGGAPHLWEMPEPALARLSDYIGSVALEADGRYAAASSPRGGQVALFDRLEARFLGLTAMADVCGLAAAAPGRFVATSGAAGGREIAATGEPAPRRLAGLDGHVWDNHVTALG